MYETSVSHESSPLCVTVLLIKKVLLFEYEYHLVH